MKTYIPYRAFALILSLLMIQPHTCHAIVGAIPGENLWRLVSRIGNTEDTIEQVVFNTESIASDTLCKVVDLTLQLKDHDSAICSKINDLNSNLSDC